MNLTSGLSSAYNPIPHRRLFFYAAWTPPADYSWKLNFAGFIADHKAGNGGAAFILRDENAILKAAFAQPVKNAENVFAAELMALRHGLQIAVTQGVDYLEIEGDSAMVFEMLYGSIRPASPTLSELIGECLHYINTFRDVRTRCVNICSNEPTNRMAVIAMGEEEPLYWYNKPPAEILVSLIEDVIGRYVPLSDT